MLDKDYAIQLAMEYGFTGCFNAEGNLTHDFIFVEAVLEAIQREREACAQVCEELDSNSYPYVVVFPNKCAEAIRERGQ